MRTAWRTPPARARATPALRRPTAPRAPQTSMRTRTADVRPSPASRPCPPSPAPRLSGRRYVWPVSCSQLTSFFRALRRAVPRRLSGEYHVQRQRRLLRQACAAHAALRLLCLWLIDRWVCVCVSACCGCGFAVGFARAIRSTAARTAIRCAAAPLPSPPVFSSLCAVTHPHKC